MGRLGAKVEAKGEGYWACPSWQSDTGEAVVPVPICGASNERFLSKHSGNDSRRGCCACLLSKGVIYLRVPAVGTALAGMTDLSLLPARAKQQPDDISLLSY